MILNIVLATLFSWKFLYEINIYNLEMLTKFENMKGR